MERLRFGHACEALQLAITSACVVSDQEHPLTGYIPYYGHPIGRALWYVRYVMREARRLGLYPSTAVLEAESRRAA